jgi:hypothetical protein
MLSLDAVCQLRVRRHGATVKLASERHSIFDIVMYRGPVGVALLFVLARRPGGTLRTPVLLVHFWRGAALLLAAAPPAA